MPLAARLVLFVPSSSKYFLTNEFNYTASVSFTWGESAAPHQVILNLEAKFFLQHAFSVVRTAGSSTYNYANPVQRDVVSIGYPGDNVTIRFETDNTGPWFLHCHIDFHLAL